MNQKAPSSYRDVVWGISALEIAVQRPHAPRAMSNLFRQWGWSDELPSWSWPGSEGKPLAVRIYTSGDRVEIRLNGVKVGEKKLAPGDKMRAEIKVPFQPGVLEAVAFAGGREIARKKLETVGPAAKLRIRPERVAGREWTEQSRFHAV